RAFRLFHESNPVETAGEKREYRDERAFGHRHRNLPERVELCRAIHWITSSNLDDYLGFSLVFYGRKYGICNARGVGFPHVRNDSFRRSRPPEVGDPTL